MNEPRRPRKPPLEPEPRATAEGVARAVEKIAPVEDSGLGPVGERIIERYLDEAEEDEAGHRRLILFPPRWRKFVRRQDETRLDAVDELIDEHLERRALKRIWKRVWAWAVVVVPLAYGWATGFFEKAWPTVKRILAALQGPTP